MNRVTLSRTSSLSWIAPALLAVGAIAMLAGCPTSGDDGPVDPVPCGDGVCTAGESVASCPADCDRCGDHTCDPEETAASCDVDCGCGNGVCNGSETNATCPGDCALPAAVRVINNSSYVIWKIFVRRCADPVWGDDRLGNQVLNPGTSYLISPLEPGCHYLRAELQDPNRFWQTPTSVNLVSGQALPWTLVN